MHYWFQKGNRLCTIGFEKRTDCALLVSENGGGGPSPPPPPLTSLLKSYASTYTVRYMPISKQVRLSARFGGVNSQRFESRATPRFTCNCTMDAPWPWMLFWLCLACCCVLCIAPKNLAFAASTPSTGGAMSASSSAPFAATAAACAAGAAWLVRSRGESQPGQAAAAAAVPQRSADDKATELAPRALRPATEATSSSESDAEFAQSSDGEEADDSASSEYDETMTNAVDSDDVSDCSEDECIAGTSTDGATAAGARGKLWTRKQFPAGCRGVRNATMPNLVAAQQWECPCTDRFNCLSEDRISTLKLYDYRNKFREVSSKAGGGLRDAARTEIEKHWDERTDSLTRTFKIGPAADCCAASAGLAMGLSFATYSTARADVRKNAPWRAARNAGRHDQEGEARAHLRAYIRDEIEAMEGPKGGADPVDHHSTPYVPLRRRWSDYSRAQRVAGQPILGSFSLFARLWKQAGVKEEKPTGHAKCDVCGTLLAEADKAKENGNAHELGRVREKMAAHKMAHRSQRDYSEDFWYKGKQHPRKVTAMSMDAPTEKQFDVPMQQRNARDVIKSLDTAKRWSSKITGVPPHPQCTARAHACHARTPAPLLMCWLACTGLMIAGLGILAYVTRAGLGSGGDLSCTILYLGLLHMVRLGVPLGTVLHVLLNNTTADNKIFSWPF